MATKKADESVTLDLADLATRVGERGSVWHKQVPFDHHHITAVSYAIIWVVSGQFTITNVVTYNGKLTAVQATKLDPGQGRPVAETDLAAHLDRLVRSGYSLATPPTEPEPEPEPEPKRRGRPRKIRTEAK